MKLNDQKLLFQLFHDGTINSIIKQKNDYTFTVDILYLAERINSQFRYFYIRLVGTTELYFEDHSLKQVITESNELQQLEFEILKVESEVDQLRVFCSVDEDTIGFLTIKTEDMIVYDQEWEILELVEVERIARGYWDDFEKRVRY